jgi:hypothetical protein
VDGRRQWSACAATDQTIGGSCSAMRRPGRQQGLSASSVAAAQPLKSSTALGAKAVRSAHKAHVGPCIPAGIQL